MFARGRLLLAVLVGVFAVAVQAAPALAGPGMLAAYSAGAAGGHGGSGPGIVGWFHYDEPDGANVSADSLPPAPPASAGSRS